jgi:hypothetical protein
MIMKRLIAAALLAGALAGCDNVAEEADDTAPTATASAAPQAPLAVDGKPVAGVFEVTSADGRMVITQTINADGTLTTVEADETRPGRWTSTGPGNLCVTMDGQDAPTCYKETVTDGVYSSVNEANARDAWTVKRLT